MENYTWSAFESGIVGNGFGDVGIIGEVAPFGRKFQIWPSAPICDEYDFSHMCRSSSQPCQNPPNEKSLLTYDRVIYSGYLSSVSLICAL